MVEEETNAGPGGAAGGLEEGGGVGVVDHQCVRSTLDVGENE